ncbi:MAG: hypothetical protein BalsKO_15380 [Balneolaceae bacterium]
MFNQDFIMRQIQQMTQVLNRILTQVLRIKNHEVQTDVLTYLDQELLKELSFDLDEILAVESEEELLSFLKKSGLNSENLNILADILFEVAESKFEDLEQHSKSLTLFSKTLFLYEFLEKSENIYSIDRNVKISKIKDVLS